MCLVDGDDCHSATTKPPLLVKALGPVVKRTTSASFAPKLPTLLVYRRVGLDQLASRTIVLLKPEQLIAPPPPVATWTVRFAVAEPPAFDACTLNCAVLVRVAVAVLP